MTDNFRVEDLIRSLQRDSVTARFYPLLPVKDDLLALLRDAGATYRNDVTQAMLDAISEAFGSDCAQLFARFLHLYDFDANKRREIRPFEGTPQYETLSELLRLPGVRLLRARLYHESGVTLSVLADRSTEEIRRMVADCIEREHRNEIVPLPKEINTHRQVAKMLRNTRTIKEEANAVLRDSGLLRMLLPLGTPHLIGSYRMDMMAWRDIDIDIENDAMSLEKLYALTVQILQAFHPHRYEAKEVVNDDGKTAWFMGFEAVLDGNNWNFDLRFFDTKTISDAVMFCDSIAERASQAQREAIVRIKRDLIERNLYAFDRYRSIDVYEAVLDKGVTDTETFLKTEKIRCS